RGDKAVGPVLPSQNTWKAIPRCSRIRPGPLAAERAGPVHAQLGSKPGVVLGNSVAIAAAALLLLDRQQRIVHALILPRREWALYATAACQQQQAGEVYLAHLH